MQKNIYMTLLIHKHLEKFCQLLITHTRFLFTALFLSCDSKAMTIHKVSTLHTSFFKPFIKKKLN